MSVTESEKTTLQNEVKIKTLQREQSETRDDIKEMKNDIADMSNMLRDIAGDVKRILQTPYCTQEEVNDLKKELHEYIKREKGKDEKLN